MLMKIFNLQPIKVTKYLFHEEHLAKDSIQSDYESGFGYKGKKIESLNTLIITFDIRYNVGKDDDLLVSYKSYSQFNFESEGFDADVLSITKFLNEYYAHTDAFFQQYGLKTIQEIEKERRVERELKSKTHLANWTSQETNDFYSNRFTSISFTESVE
jgi:hypothetical protein